MVVSPAAVRSASRSSTSVASGRAATNAASRSSRRRRTPADELGLFQRPERFRVSTPLFQGIDLGATM